MRKHDVRKWIHAVLDMLPLFIIPIFAIYMRNENSTRDISVDYDVNQVVDFNQYVLNPKPSSTDTYTLNQNNSGTLYIEDDYLVYEVSTITTESYRQAFGNFSQFNDLVSGHVFYSSVVVKCYSQPFVISFGGTAIYNTTIEMSANTTYKVSYVFTGSFTNNNNNNRYFYISNFNDVVGTKVGIKYNMLTDLTQMFGSGNEPSKAQYESIMSADYYDYTTSKKILINNGTETYNNTDVGSQMMYSLYTPIKEYFNLNNVANFGSIYDWLQLNFFNGTAPMSVFIVWNIILYEFIMDVLFLIYAVFMFIIDFVECLIDKAFGKSYRGGR